MHLLAAFFITNRWVISFVYPLTFFLIGFGILLKNKVHSRFSLGNSLNYLGAFGLIHSFADWGNIFIPLQGTYLNDTALFWLHYGQIVLRSFSFAVLFYFGTHLLQLSKQINRKVLFLPLSAFTTWLIFSIFIKVLLPEASFIPIILASSNILIVLPAGLLSAYSIYIQKNQFIEFGIHFMSKTLTLTSLSLVTYILLVGTVFPYTHWLSSSPFEWLRSLNGAIMFIFFLRILRAFDIEYQQYFRTAEKNIVLTEERNRIARDLHDGMIQSIYAFGLQLETLRYQFENGKLSDPKLVTNSLKKMTNKMNELIVEIRSYIIQLKTATDDTSNFHLNVQSLIDDINHASSVHVQFQCAFEGIEPPPWISSQIYYIIKEALSNIVKHAKASQAIVSIQRDNMNLFIEIRDNGQGFPPTNDSYSNGFKQGIINMNDRAKIIGGKLTIVSNEYAGTTVKLNVTLDSWEVMIGGRKIDNHTR